MKAWGVWVVDENGKAELYSDNEGPIIKYDKKHASRIILNLMSYTSAKSATVVPVELPDGPGEAR